MSEMTDPGWRERVITYIRSQAAPEDKFGHQPRLYALARQIADVPDPGLVGVPDDDVVFAAAWMHDLGVFLGHRPLDPAQLASWDHVPYTIDRSQALLLEWAFPSAKLHAVAEAIRTHQAKDDPVTTEAIVLRDADILEQLGAIGALRAMVKVGRDTRFPTYSDALVALEKALETLPRKLRLPKSRELAENRILALKVFLDAIRQEGGQLLY